MIIKGKELDICFDEIDDKYLSVKDAWFIYKQLSTVMECIENILCEKLDDVNNHDEFLDAIINMVQDVKNAEWSENG